SSGEVTINRDFRVPIRGRDVLVIEDIVDTGNTMHYLQKHLATHKPKSVAISSLLFKPSRLLQNVKVDFLGFTIEDHFVVGYGLDLDNRFRELKEVVIYVPEGEKDE